MAIDNKKIIGEVINLGSNYEISIKNLKNLIMKINDRKVKIEISPQRIRPKKSEVHRLYVIIIKQKSCLNGNLNIQVKRV